MEQLGATLYQHGIDGSLLRRIDYGGDIPLYHVVVSLQDRLDTWVRLRNLVDHTAHWPVIVDDLRAITNYAYQSWAGTPAQILDEVRSLNVEEWLLKGTGLTHYPDARQIIDEVLEAIEAEHEYLGDQLVAYDHMRDTAKSALTQDALWYPDRPLLLGEQLGFTDGAVSKHRQAASCDMVLFPIGHWWEIPALIRYYPADPSPDPATHACLFQRWAERYGAELVRLGRKDLTLRALQPPSDRATAIALAWEHTQYCQDIATLDIVQRAVELYQGAAWAFWWD